MPTRPDLAQVSLDQCFFDANGWLGSCRSTHSQCRTRRSTLTNCERVLNLSRMIAVALLLVAVAGFSAQRAYANEEEYLALLRSPDSGKRLDGLYGLEFSLDPRIPEAMLPLLDDEGNSIRVRAARAIGSRWWQIPKERVPEFTEALKPNSRVENDLRESSMGLRGIGLLSRDYSSDSFSRSPDKRWVVYERFSCPCLIDTQSGTEQIIGWSRPEELGNSEGVGCGFLPTWNETTVKDSTLWRRDSEMAAFALAHSRVQIGALVWMQEKGTKLINPDEVEELLRGMGYGCGLLSAIPKRWKGKILELDVYPSMMSGDGKDFESCVLSWNPDTDSLAILSVKDAEPE